MLNDYEIPEEFLDILDINPRTLATLTPHQAYPNSLLPWKREGNIIYVLAPKNNRRNTPEKIKDRLREINSSTNGSGLKFKLARTRLPEEVMQEALETFYPE